MSTTDFLIGAFIAAIASIAATAAMAVPPDCQEVTRRIAEAGLHIKGIHHYEVFDSTEFGDSPVGWIAAFFRRRGDASGGCDEAGGSQPPFVGVGTG